MAGICGMRRGNRQRSRHGPQAETTSRAAGRGNRHGQQDWGKRRLKRNLLPAVSAWGRGNSSADSFGAVVPEEVGLLSVVGR